MDIKISVDTLPELAFINFFACLTKYNFRISFFVKEKHRMSVQRRKLSIVYFRKIGKVLISGFFKLLYDGGQYL